MLLRLQGKIPSDNINMKSKNEYLKALVEKNIILRSVLLILLNHLAYKALICAVFSSLLKNLFLGDSGSGLFPCAKNILRNSGFFSK